MFFIFCPPRIFKTIADSHCTHCQSPTSQRNYQSFDKELAKQTQKEENIKNAYNINYYERKPFRFYFI